MTTTNTTWTNTEVYEFYLIPTGLPMSEENPEYTIDDLLIPTENGTVIYQPGNGYTLGVIPPWGNGETCELVPGNEYTIIEGTYPKGYLAYSAI